MEARVQSAEGALDGPESWAAARFPNCSATAFAKQRLIRAEAFSCAFSDGPPRPSFSQVSSGAPIKKFAPGWVLSPPDHHVQISASLGAAGVRLQSSWISSGPVSDKA